MMNGASIVLAIPAGGVPIGWEIAMALRLPMDVIVVRKIQIPGNTEAGFGAIGPDGEILLNEPLMQDLHLTRKEIEDQVAHTKDVLKLREARFRKGRPFPELKDKQVILVDDGLASGYTMLAAITFVKHDKPQEVIVAVPTSSARAIDFILGEVNELFCANIRTGPYFAVAEAYRNWYDLTDEEVIRGYQRFHSGSDTR